MSLPRNESLTVSSSEVSSTLPLADTGNITANRETAEFLKAFANAHGLTGDNEKCLDDLAPFSMNALQALSKSELQQQIGSSVVGKLLFFQLTCKPPFRALSQPVEPS
ncbi:MAG: hypothetical protein K2Z81_03095, partial [Cyanobacteria bacterium]|nr:hypothetical protein [Cyanobacteriota bacterium]